MSVLANLAKVNTATTGTGTMTLGTAVTGFLTFAAAGIANGDVVSYAIRDGSNSEVGTGTYSSTGPTLTRSPVTSTNSNAAIALSGSAVVMVTPLAADLAAAAGSYKSARYWRLMLVNAIGSAGLIKGFGLCNLQWKDSGGTNLVGSGTPSVSANDNTAANPWTTAAGFASSMAANNGWYSGDGSHNGSTIGGDWIAYDFTTGVIPRTVSFAPLNGSVWSVGQVLAIEYSADGTVWKELCKINTAAGAVSGSATSYTLPTTGA